MKTTFKKIAAFTAATLMAAALAVPAFAADPSWLEDPEKNPIVDFGTSPSFNKSLTIYNEMAIDAVAVPRVTYTYSVSVVDPDGEAEIEDKDGYKAIVKAGVPGGFSLANANSTTGKASVQFTDTTVNLETLDTKIGLYYGVATEPVAVEYNPDKFEEAGVYRYMLTEESSDFDKFGITRDVDTNGKVYRYVDVYVRESETEGEFEVYGTVMFSGADDTNLDISSLKTDGFTNDGNNTGKKDDDGTYDPEEEIKRDPNNYNGDELYTYNYLVKKEVKNSMLGNEEFPFTVIATSGDTTCAQTFKIVEDGYASSDDALAAAASISDDNGTVNPSTTPASIDLADGEYLALVAVPANVSISVTEENDEAAMYDVTASDAKEGSLTLLDEENEEEDTADAGDKLHFAPIALTDYADDVTAVPTANLTLTTFTNEMHSISPTGLLFTVAPFAAMAGLGAGMIVLFAKNKKREDAENII